MGQVLVEIKQGQFSHSQFLYGDLDNIMCVTYYIWVLFKHEFVSDESFNTLDTSSNFKLLPIILQQSQIKYFHADFKLKKWME